MSTGSADIIQLAKSGTTVPWNGANKAPASPKPCHRERGQTVAARRDSEIGGARRICGWRRA